MIKKNLVMAFVLLFAVQFVFAFETNVTINTLSDHTLNLQFLNPSPPPISFEAFNVDSGDSGVVNYVFSNSAESFDLIIILMEGNKKIADKRFNGIETGKNVMITFISSNVFDIDKDYVAPVETTPVSEEANILDGPLINETEEVFVENSTDQITGNTIGKESNETSFFSGFFNKVKSIIGFSVEENEINDSQVDEQEGNSYSKFIFYFVGAFILLGILFFVVGRVKENRGKDEKRSVDKKYSGRDEEDDEDSYMKDAENKMAEAETEIRIADEAKRLKDVKDRLNKDKEYLRRIRESKGEQ